MQSDFDDVLAIIPARKGSKRLPGKNSAMFEGMPLWLRTLNLARDVGIKKIAVTTDDEEILRYGSDYPLQAGVKFYQRSEKNAGDDASTEDVIYEVIDQAMHDRIEYKNICLLQPTSPLLTATTLKHALNTFKDNNMRCLVAVNKMMKPAGAFYIFSSIEFQFYRGIWMDGLYVYVLDEEESIDVDNIWDFKIAQCIAQNRVVRK